MLPRSLSIASLARRIHVAVEEPSPVKTIGLLVAMDRTASIEKIEDSLRWLQSNSFPPDVTPISIRSSLVHYSGRMTPEGLLLSLETFAKAGIPDHLLFKEIGKLLEPRVQKMSVTDVSRLLRAHAQVSITESPLFQSVFERLSTIINRANMSVIRDILVSLSKLQSSVPGCMRMAELCVNRYSLASKESINTDIEKDILLALGQLRYRSPKVLRKLYSRILSRADQFSLEDLIKIMLTLNSFELDITTLWKLSLSGRLSHISILSSHDLASLSVFADPAFAVRAAVINGRRLMNQPVEMRTLQDSIIAFKHRLVLTRAAMLQPTDTGNLLWSLSLDDLRSLNEIISLPSGTVCETMQGKSLLNLKRLELKAQDVAGLFTTQLLVKNRL
jgi:hypothetical protein